MSIKLKFLGGVRTVTGSSHLLTTPYSQVLLDCGIFYGHRDEFYQVNSTFSFNPRKLNAVLLSHAHIDHCGNIPSLIKNGLRCKIYTTIATKDLCKLMLADSGKIQEEDIYYINKINRRLGMPLRKPLYTEKEGRRASRRFRSLPYRKRFKLTKDITCAFYDAGHILGSAIIVLDIKSVKSNIRVGYAVDLGRKNLPFLNDPTVVEGMDYLILESTYGARRHEPISLAKIKLKEAINRTYNRKGKVIIPSFALERTQEVVYFLNELIRDKEIPELPIYVDSPLATDITDVFRTHSSFFDEETRIEMKTKPGPLDFVHLNYIRDKKDSKALNHDPRPMIIIAGSGMCEAGRILHHLKNNISESRNTILIVGYMANNTLGKKIVDRERIVKIFGIEHELNAEVVIINSFSGHADCDDLVKYVQECLPIKKVFVVHGEVAESENLVQLLQNKGIDAYLPEKGQELQLEDG